MLAQYLVVALVVVAALLAAGRKYLPKTWRQRLVHVVSRGSGKGRFAAWLGGPDTGCGSGCGSCGTCEPVRPPQDGKGRKVIKLHVQR
jgi:hypothetical protein